MKNKYITALLKICFLFMSCMLIYTACDKDEDVNTDQLNSSEVTLKSFGPSPIPRGAELRIIGSNVDKVQSVILPGSAAITTIKVISKDEIRVIVPQDAQRGLITLNTPNGEIKSITEITFDEPISITSISPNPVKAGAVLKIAGEYLNRIEEIIFFDDVHVLKADFVSQSREAIEVVVPKEAQTGKIIVSDGADIIPDETGEFGIPVWVYSDEDLLVVLPAINTIAPSTIKAGSTLTITGSDFDLVDQIIFAGEKVVTAFTKNSGFTQIEVVVPVDAQDGAVTLVAPSGVEVVSATPITLVVPSELNVSPKTVKNGAQLTISGNDLDLVSSVTFGDLTGEIVSKSATSLVVKVPNAANSTTVSLQTQAEKTVQTPAIAYVKPQITKIEPLTIMAGNDITIEGKDLDLVSLILFESAIEPGTIITKSETAITVTVPPSATSGTVKLVAVNGDEVLSTQTLNVEAADLPVIISISSSVKPGGLLKIQGTKLNLVESILFADNVKATNYGLRSAELIEVYVPETAKKGKVTLTLTTYNGKTVESPQFNISGTDPVVDPALIIYDFENGLAGSGRWNGVGQESSEDGVSGLYYEITASNWNTGYWWFAENHMVHPSVSGKADYVVKIDIRLKNDIPAPTAGRSEVRLMFSGQAVNILSYLLDEKGTNWQEGGVWTTGGDWKTIAIPLSEWAGLNDPTPSSGGDWGIATWINGSDFTGFCVDNIRYEQK
ncbi:MAG: glycan-binding surface protein [Dysgonamonadaceae bacterium]|jgi:hypothetical protein|nr:glycan-binding surface protein [Dysgonamonadaceae bacterium]